MILPRTSLQLMNIYGGLYISTKMSTRACTEELKLYNVFQSHEQNGQRRNYLFFCFMVSETLSHSPAPLILNLTVKQNTVAVEECGRGSCPFPRRWEAVTGRSRSKMQSPRTCTWQCTSSMQTPPPSTLCRREPMDEFCLLAISHQS